jgi:hypothetical protein
MKKIVLMLLAIYLAISVVSAAETTTVTKDISLKVVFNEVADAYSNNSTNTQIVIYVNGTKFAEYDWEMGDKPTYYKNGVNSNDDDVNSGDTISRGDGEIITKALDFKIDSGDCSGTTTSLMGGLQENLSYCYSSLQKVIGLEATCIDKSGQAAEFQAKYETCNTDVTEKETAVTSLTSERDTAKTDSSQCKDALSACSATKQSCIDTKASETQLKDEYKGKADQTILYVLGTAIAVFFITRWQLTGGRRNADYNADEQEFQQQGDEYPPQ